MAKNTKPLKTALVLSGGGARGAYEAGIMHYVLSVLIPKYKLRNHFDVYCGSSVGAINTCFMASAATMDPVEAGRKIYQTWHDLRQEEIYARHLAALTSFVAKSASGMVLNLFRTERRKPKTTDTHHFKGLFDTSPLPKFLKRHIDFDTLNANVVKGPVDAVTLTATNVATGYMELFVKKKKSVPYTGQYVFRETDLDALHAVASGAIPIAFPPQKIGKYYYVDGGLRLNTPMSPAIQLGANRILIIGMHNVSAREKHVGSEIDIVYPPTLGQVIGKVLHSIFLDRIDYDMEQMTRINRIVEWGEMRYGHHFLQNINDMLDEKRIRGDIANRGLQHISAHCVYPTADIAALFAETIGDPKVHHSFFGGFEKLLLKILDVDLVQGQDFLSYLMFVPEYIRKLLDLGYHDAEKQKDELAEFLGG